MAGYGDDGGFNIWLTENGHTLPADAPMEAVLRNRGTEYIDGASPPVASSDSRNWSRLKKPSSPGNLRT